VFSFGWELRESRTATDAGGLGMVPKSIPQYLKPPSQAFRCPGLGENMTLPPQYLPRATSASATKLLPSYYQFFGCSSQNFDNVITPAGGCIALYTAPPPAYRPGINTLFLVLREWGGWCRLVKNYPGINGQQRL